VRVLVGVYGQLHRKMLIEAADWSQVMRAPSILPGKGATKSGPFLHRAQSRRGLAAAVPPLASHSQWTNRHTELPFTL
jgi:hypothetical protein